MLWRLLRSALRPAPSSARELQRALDLRREGRHREAEQVLRAAVREHPYDAAAATNLAVALLEQDCAPEALPLLERALEIDPRFAPAHFNYAHLLRLRGDIGAAIRHYQAAMDSDPTFVAAPEALMQGLLQACDWDRAERIAHELERRAAREPSHAWLPFISPLTAMCLKLDPEQAKAVAAFHAPKPVARGVALRSRSGGRLKIAYLSHDFRNHPTAHMVAGAFPLHDREHFEVYAYSTGPDDGSVWRHRIIQGVEHFVDIARADADTAAAAIAGAGIDVLIDLMGHCIGNRLAVLARRCAPVQVHFLGYPGTIGAAYVDYFIGDPIVSPPDLDAHFVERVIRVPDCYQLNEASAAFSTPTSPRAAHGLPEDVYVFCNFGNPMRIDRRSFGLWMRILQEAPRSVLWLLRTSAIAMENMRREAVRYGIDPQRLVFGPPLEKSAHVERLPCADMGLDTLEWYNGHSTAADLLWSGVPLLTRSGCTFATRVSESALVNAGLPDLVADSDDAFCALAVAIARSPERAAQVRGRLLAARESAPLFDTARLVRGLEGAYESMHAAVSRGAPTA